MCVSCGVTRSIRNCVCVCARLCMCVCVCVAPDSGMLTDMMKGNLTNVLPMIVIGGWINWAFSGFVISES